MNGPYEEAPPLKQLSSVIVRDDEEEEVRNRCKSRHTDKQCDDEDDNEGVGVDLADNNEVV